MVITIKRVLVSKSGSERSTGVKWRITGSRVAIKLAVAITRATYAPLHSKGVRIGRPAAIERPEVALQLESVLAALAGGAISKRAACRQLKVGMAWSVCD
jgi:hypothetical protein